MSTVGERIGAPKHGYIPLAKREGVRNSRDPEGRKSAIIGYLKEHDGQPITMETWLEVTGLVTPNIVYRYLGELEKKKKLTREKRGSGVTLFHIGHKPLPRNGEPEITKPAAPVKRSQMEKMEAEAWEYIKSIAGEDNDILGAKTKGVVGYLAHLAGHLLPKEDNNEQV